MHRLALISIAALSLAACSGESTAPDSLDTSLLGAGAFGTALTTTGGYDAGVYNDRLVNALPDSLKLTDEQRAKIKALTEAFLAATKSDREALNGILREAKQAIEAKKPRSEVEAILKRGFEIRLRLAAAEAKLKAAIHAVSTAEQREWIRTHQPTSCKADRFPPLTDAQKAAIADVKCGVIMMLNDRSGWPKCSSSGRGATIRKASDATMDKLATGFSSCRPKT